MGLFVSFFNALIISIVLFLYWDKRKRFDIYFVILATYTLIAIFGFLLINSGSRKFDLSIFNAIYLISCILIFIYPFKYAKFSKANISIVENKLLNWLLFIYFISGLVSLVYAIPKTLMLIALDNWKEVRNQLYADSDSVELYSNGLDRLAKNIFSYLSPFGLVMTMYQLTKTKFNVIYTFAIFLVWFANTYCAATLVASRGMIVVHLVQIIIIYLVFRNNIPKRREKYIFVSAAVIGVFLAGYMIAVSQSRFGDDAGDSVFYYLGHSFLSFNQDVMTPIHDYGYGKYFFKWLCPLFGINPNLDLAKLGCTSNSAFITFVGCFYVDFGPIGTLIFAGIFSYMLCKFTRKNKYNLSDIIVITYFANWLLNGSLVVARSQSLAWLMVFVVYFIIRTIEPHKKHNIKKL